MKDRVLSAVGNQWLIASGLTGGEQVIIEGIQKVRPGAPAKIVPSDKALTPGPSANNADKPAEPAN